MNGMSVRITIAKWLPIAVVIVGCVSFTYIGVQQHYRSSMNQPQVQMAEDGALALAHGAVPADIVPRNSAPIDPSQSLSPFIGIYDKDGTPLEVNAILNGAPPKPPIGVFTSALARGENRVTWQPQNGVRIALVVVPVPNSGGWYVASGRSMREGEDAIDQLGALALSAAMLMLAVTLALELFGAWRHARAVASAHPSGNPSQQPAQFQQAPRQ